MKILHIGNIAGIPQILAAKQKGEGWLSETLSFSKHPFGYSSDHFFLPKWHFNRRYLPSFKILIKIMALIMKYDILHFHYSSLIANGIDCLLWKIMGKRIVMHYHGSDIRGKGEKLFRRRFSDVSIVSTPDLLEYSERAVWMPNPINLEEYKPVEQPNTGEGINIVHLPSARAEKGTEYVISAIEELKREGYNIKFTLVENIPHQEVMSYYNQADIVVDQLLIGWYGMVTIEAMALKKPVCVYIREDLVKYLPFIPFCISSKDDIAVKLKELIEDRELRKELGEKGRHFVEQVHDVNLVNEKIMKLYDG